MLRGAMPFTIVRLLTRVGRSPSGRLVAADVACVLIGAALFSITQHISYGRREVVVVADRVMFGVDKDPVLAEGDRLLSLEPDRS